MPPKRQLDDVAYYLVGWIAPLLNEQTAAIASLDEEHGRPKNFERPSEDPNAYTWGCIKGHNIVIVSLGATVYGTVNASIVATRMRLALPHLRVGLLVGIGAGLNVKRSDIRLGDVVVSKPGEKDGGVIQYDLTKNGLGAPERIGFLSHPFTPRIHYGTIASGNRLVKSAREREILISQLSDTCLCLEMEAAGVMNTFPCLVIRGICDYADTHKNDAWQNYAAITATAFASELLGHLDIGEVQATKPIRMMDVKVSKLNRLEEVIKEEFGPVNEHIHDNKRRQIEHWISPEDQDTRHRDVHGSRQEGTGDWFLQNLDAWTHTPGARQWCLGPAGAGKTVLASSIINHLRHMNASSPRKVLFYYFDYQKKDGHKADRFCANLLKQLSMQSEQLLSSLRIAHERSIYPEKGEMFVKFIQETEKAGKVYIVVDALDECFSDHGSAADVLGLLRRLPKNVSWLITARKTPETQKMTQPERGFYLIESNEGDIARFLHKMVSNEQGFQEMLVNTPGLEDEIRISVIQNSNSK
ncbi:hypothetical protein D6C77_05258 [Aureobasidium pullulans]|nr:hypothetical protein D6C77_05258 [Aureobasidium pullulans]